MKDDQLRQMLCNQYGTPDRLAARIELHQRFSVHPRGWVPWVLDCIRMPVGGRVLDVGCGTGGLWRGCAERMPMVEVVITDLHEGMVSAARGGIGTAAPWATFCVADAQRLPFPDGSFDAAIANHMLYHVPDRARALSELARVLSPGGRLYATTVGLENMPELFSLLERFQIVAETGPGPLHAPFCLENGAAQLSEHFGQVEWRLYEDALRVTEAGPLVGYTASMARADGATSSRIEAMGRWVEKQIRSEGPLIIGKSAGMFIATRT